jgi:hypothetical protein
MEIVQATLKVLLMDTEETKIHEYTNIKMGPTFNQQNLTAHQIL